MAAVETTTNTKNSITLKGSAELVSEFFWFGINSILYQRGIYPSEMFTKSSKYGLTLLVTADEKLSNFINPVLEQIKAWLMKKELQRLVLVISSVHTKEVLERWQFDIETEQSVTNDPSSGSSAPSAKEKPEKVIRQEICDVIRQITASVTFLPLLDEPCSFDILIYTRKNSEVPQGWGETGPCMILNSQEVQLRSFSTSIHTVETKVSYKSEDY